MTSTELGELLKSVSTERDALDDYQSAVLREANRWKILETHVLHQIQSRHLVIPGIQMLQARK